MLVPASVFWPGRPASREARGELHRLDGPGAFKKAHVF